MSALDQYLCFPAHSPAAHLLSSPWLIFFVPQSVFCICLRFGFFIHWFQTQFQNSLTVVQQEGWKTFPLTFHCLQNVPSRWQFHLNYLAQNRFRNWNKLLYSEIGDKSIAFIFGSKEQFLLPYRTSQNSGSSSVGSAWTVSAFPRNLLRSVNSRVPLWKCGIWNSGSGAPQSAL